jgi:hypothetical protein
VLECVLSILAAVLVFFHSRGDTALEILALRQQVAVLKRKRPRPPLTAFDRLFWSALWKVWTRWTEALVIVKPETIVGGGTGVGGPVLAVAGRRLETRFVF